MGWIRLDVAAFSDRSLRRAGPAGKRAFIAALMLSKSRDWRNNDEPGWLPHREFDGSEVALHWGDPDTPEVVAAYDNGIRVLLSEGIFRSDVGGYWITGWRTYQPDQSALARKRKERREKWKKATDQATASGVSRGVTVCHDASQSDDARHEPSCDVTPRDVDVHVTRRDVDVDGTETETETGRSTDSHSRTRTGTAPELPPGVATFGVYKREPPPPVTSDTLRIVAEEKAKMRSTLAKNNGAAGCISRTPADDGTATTTALGKGTKEGTDGELG